MALYSDKVMEHFLQPRNVGVIEDADGVGEVGNARRKIRNLRLRERDRLKLDGNRAYQGSACRGRAQANQQSGG